MWGTSPIVGLSVNGKECRLLNECSRFVYLCSPKQGYNTVNIELNPNIFGNPPQNQWDDGLKLLTQVMQLQAATKAEGGRLSGGSKPSQPISSLISMI